MSLKRTTPVPNVVLDLLISVLSMAELKVLLVIVRQTNGWRKSRDWISQSQFVHKTGLSRQTVSQTLAVLQHHRIISITNRTGMELRSPQARRGRTRLFYALGNFEGVGLLIVRCKVGRTTLVGLLEQDKRNSTKDIDTNGLRSIADILPDLFK